MGDARIKVRFNSQRSRDMVRLIIYHLQTSLQAPERGWLQIWLARKLTNRLRYEAGKISMPSLVAVYPYMLVKAGTITPQMSVTDSSA